MKWGGLFWGLLTLGGLLRAETGDWLDADARAFLIQMPKAELHVHLEGLLEPEQYLELVARNGLEPKYPTVEAVKERLIYQRDLNTFIEVYEELLSAMYTEEDFYEVAMAYIERVAAQGVLRVEMFFDPQMHTTRGIPLDVVMRALIRARADAATQFGVSLAYIPCFNRDRSAESAMALLPELVAWKEKAALLGIGLDNPEVAGFPDKFAEVFAAAAEAGFRLTTHCDVNIPNSVAHHWGALDVLKVERIDHGLNVIDDPALVAAVKARGIGLTACVTLLYRDIPGRIEDRAQRVRGLVDAGIPLCLNSDDPGLMRSLYVGDLYVLLAETGLFTREEMVNMARDSFRMAWIPDAEKAALLERLEAFVGKDEG
jgi:adenosine deaminase